MSYTATTFHQLDLLLIYTDDCPIRISRTVQSNNKAIGKGGNLIIISNARHRASLRYYITEMVKQVKQNLLRQWVRITAFYASNLTSQTMVHISRRLFIDIAISIFQSIFVYPDLGCQLISGEIIQRGFICFIKCIDFTFHSCIFI